MSQLFTHAKKIQNIKDSKNRWGDYNEERGGTLVVLPLLVIGC